MTSPIQPYTVWKTYPRNIPKEGRTYHITDGPNKTTALFINNQWLNHKLERVIGWREKNDCNPE